MEVLNTSASGWNRGFGFMTPDLSGIPTVDDQPDHTTMPTTPTTCMKMFRLQSVLLQHHSCQGTCSYSGEFDCSRPGCGRDSGNENGC